MTTALIILNILLLAAVIFLFLKKPKEKSGVLSELEDIELIEFQHNMRQLVEEMEKSASLGVSSINSAKTELDKKLKETETVIKELKYLLERNRLQRTAEYKTEISSVQEPAAAVPVVQEAKPQAEPAIITRQPAVFEIKEEPKNPKQAVKPSVKDKYDRVGKLLDNGMAVQEIASVTGMSFGEIELIKNLKKQ
ncbi:MAG: hypothetical protein JXR81_04360 [Candidatus Goldbacteria bacterium]|nr:hypothetical protein [Candidatus Goldiibacteriota bacterium]